MFRFNLININTNIKLCIRRLSTKEVELKYNINIVHVSNLKTHDNSLKIINKNNLIKKNYSSNISDSNISKKYESKINYYDFYQSDKMIG